MTEVREADLTWEGGMANVGLYYMLVYRGYGGNWGWKVDDGESYRHVASGSAATEREAQRAAVEALLTHLEKCAAECRAALEGDDDCAHT